jgi:hypothetical protein
MGGKVIGRKRRGVNGRQGGTAGAAVVGEQAMIPRGVERT